MPDLRIGRGKPAPDAQCRQHVTKFMATPDLEVRIGGRPGGQRQDPAVELEKGMCDVQRGPRRIDHVQGDVQGRSVGDRGFKGLFNPAAGCGDRLFQEADLLW